MIEIELGTVARLGGNVITIVDLLPKTSGTIYAGIQFHLPGHADNGKYWDTNAGGSWQASPTTWPTATHRSNGFWDYDIPSASLVLHAEIKVVFLTDNQATPASATVVGGGYETGVVVTRDREKSDDLTRTKVVDTVYVDLTNGSPTGDGTPNDPVDSLTAAKTIADTDKKKRIRVTCEVATEVDFTQAWDGFEFIGNGPSLPVFDFNSQVIDSCIFRHCTLKGITTGVVHMRDCTINGFPSPAQFQGTLRECILDGTIAVAGAIVSQDCAWYLSAAGLNGKIDFTPGVGSFVAHSMRGQVTSINNTTGKAIEISGNGAELIIDSSCTSSVVRLRGNMKYTDSGSNTVLTDDRDVVLTLEESVTDHSGVSGSLAEAIDIMNEDQQGKWEITTAGGGTLNIYKSDNVTLLMSFELYDIDDARTSEPAAIVKRVRV